MRTMNFKIAVVAIICTSTLVGCDVVNPGPIQDEFLAEPASQQGLINGAIRRMNELIGDGSYTMAIVSRELLPGGQTGASGHDVIVQGGEFLPGSFGAYFNDAVQARFIGETAIKRFTAVEAPASSLYQAHLWTGWAYRYLGDWWCDAVVASEDPADRSPGEYEVGTRTYYQRAVNRFTDALNLANTESERFAALAGRAQAYIGLDQWANAATDAAAITNPGWVFRMNMDAAVQANYNQIHWANNRTPYANFSLEFTFAKQHYTDTGDPRVAWFTDPVNQPFAGGALSGFGQVPWVNQRKYDDRGDPINMASYWEMRLIMAEAILQQTPANYAQAMVLINEVHTRIISDSTGEPLPALTAANANEAWTHLKRERQLELFLEGRRATDERRWQTDGSGGTIDTPDWSSLSNIFVPINSRSLCFDIPTAERDSNPNVPTT